MLTENLHKLLSFKISFLLFLLIGFIIYFNSLFNSFLWDDMESVVENNLVHTIANIDQSLKGGGFYSGGNNLAGFYYRPIIVVYFSLVNTIFGVNAYAFHLMQIVLHIFTTFLLFVLLSKFSSKLAAFLLSVIFLVHPINSETVLYISASGESLFLPLGLMSILVILYKNSNFTNIFLVFISLLLSFLSKETAFLFLILASILSVIEKKYKYLWGILISFGVYLNLRIFIGGFSLFGSPGGSVNITPIANLDFLSRILNIPAVIFFYLKTFFLPLDLQAAQVWIVTKPDLGNFVFPLIAILFLFSICIYQLSKFRQAKNFKYQLFFFIWIILGFGLHSHIIPSLDMTVAERWFYFTFVGVLGFLNFVFLNYWEYFKPIYLKREKVLLLVCILIFLMLSIKTYLRTYDWRDAYALFNHDYRSDKDNFLLESGLGIELLNQGNTKQAFGHLQKSVNLVPNWYVSLNGLASVYYQNGEVERSIEYYIKSIEANQNHLAYQNLSRMLVVNKRYNEAKQVLSIALKKYPKNNELWLSFAVAEYKLGNLKSAKLAAEKAYSLKPSPLNKFFLDSILNNQPLEF